MKRVIYLFYCESAFIIVCNLILLVVFFLLNFETKIYFFVNVSFFYKKKTYTQLPLASHQIASIMTDTNERDEEGQTQLSLAAEAGDVDEVARLLTDKADPELKDDDGFVRPRSFSCVALCDANTNLLSITYFL